LLALGLDPHRSTLYLQSDLPEVCELSWLIGCTLAKGLLNRGHAYKSLVEENRRAARPDDAGVTAGIFDYPLLMAADILIHEAEVVPVGEDNRQHIEIARDAAAAFNGRYGEVFTIPEGRIEERVAVIPGTDGRKMSKSYGNVVPIFGAREDISRRIRGVLTDSRRPDEPKDPESCNVFRLLRLVATEDVVADVAERYRSGGIGYGEVKDLLIEAHELRFGHARERFHELRADETHVRTILADGAQRARGGAQRQLERARAAVGITSGGGCRGGAGRQP
jgi:tryptophanyl-tRNA synthetase